MNSQLIQPLDQLEEAILLRLEDGTVHDSQRLCDYLLSIRELWQLSDVSYPTVLATLGRMMERGWLIHPPPLLPAEYPVSPDPTQYEITRQGRLVLEYHWCRIQEMTGTRCGLPADPGFRCAMCGAEACHHHHDVVANAMVLGIDRTTFGKALSIPSSETISLISRQISAVDASIDSMQKSERE